MRGVLLQDLTPLSHEEHPDGKITLEGAERGLGHGDSDSFVGSAHGDVSLKAIESATVLFYNFGNMEAEAVINVLGALAQETRLAIFRLLVQAGPEGRAAGVIAESLRVPLATLSFHLQQLKQARLVRAQRKGTSIIYAANYTTMNELMCYLTENCCEGRPELCAEASAGSEAQMLPLAGDDCCERSQVK